MFILINTTSLLHALEDKDIIHSDDSDLLDALRPECLELRDIPGNLCMTGPGERAWDANLRIYENHL
jgi:hypothetical protein